MQAFTSPGKGTTLRREHLVQGDITATVWPDAKRGIALIPGDWHPSYAAHESYADWIDMQTDLARMGLEMAPEACPLSIVADVEVVEIRPLAVE